MMLQFSVYMRHCNSRQNAEVHIKRVKNLIPPRGDVIIFTLTDKQFGMMELFKCAKAQKQKESPQQLELF